MAGQLKIGGNVIATHAGTEGAGTVTLDSSTLTIGSNTTVTMGAGSIGTAVTMSANQPAVKTALNASGSAPIYACRAWVNFNGVGTLAIRGSGNVSSVTDNGTGNYTINYTTAMEDGHYAAVINIPPFNYTSGARQHFNHIEGTTDYSTSSLNVESGTIAQGSPGTNYDMQVVSVSIFR